MSAPWFDDSRIARLTRRWAVACAVLVLAGCSTPLFKGASSPTPAPAERDRRPAERVVGPGEAELAQGTKLYQAGQYGPAEAQLKKALQEGLPNGADRANAHKYLAFIYCTSAREALCWSAFKAARQADPAFALSKAEAGHPMWGPVYRKALGVKGR